MLPSQTDYATIVKNLKSFISDEYINSGTPIYKKNKLMGIVNYTGGFSKVFPINIDGERVALRFWTKDVEDSKNRYKEIDRYLKVKKLPYFVGFHYVENKLNWQGNKYPFIYMDWVEGRSLLKYINENIHDKSKIKRLAEKFYMMVQSLHQYDIAHGDLQDENILVIENKNDIILKLIDYDTIYVPKLKGFTLDIVGVEAYQHPKKNNIKTINEKIDYFSELVIYLSLLVYSENSSLWDPDARRQLLFTQKDFLNPNKSNIFKEIKKKKYSKNVRDLTKKLIEFCHESDILKLEPLESLLIPQFEDKELDDRYQAFLKMVSPNKKLDKNKVSDTVLTYLKENKEKITTKGKIYKYLDFSISQHTYVLPRDYQELVSDKDFSLIDNIYSFYTIDELGHIGSIISIDNMVGYAKKMTFEEQKQLQDIYHLRSKYVPSEFYVKIKDDFMITIPYVDTFIRKDILKRTLDKSVLSEKDKKWHITNIENSSLVNYTKNVNNAVDAIADEYLIPSDYKKLTKGTGKSINYVTANFDTLEEVKKIGSKVAVNNIVDLARTGTYDEQKTIHKLEYLDDKFIPKDYSRLLQKDFYAAINKSDNFIVKKDAEKILYDFKMSKEQVTKHKKFLTNSNSYDYDKSIDKIKEDIIDVDNYSEEVQNFYKKLSLKHLGKKKDIIMFLKKQFMKIKLFKFIFIFFNTVVVIGTFIFANNFSWLLPLVLVVNTYFFDLSFRAIDKIPEKYINNNKQISVQSKVFSEEVLDETGKYRKITLLLAFIIAIYSFVM